MEGEVRDQMSGLYTLIYAVGSGNWSCQFEYLVILMRFLVLVPIWCLGELCPLNLFHFLCHGIILTAQLLSMSLLSEISN